MKTDEILWDLEDLDKFLNHGYLGRYVLLAQIRLDLTSLKQLIAGSKLNTLISQVWLTEYKTTFKKINGTAEILAIMSYDKKFELASCLFSEAFS